ncbi:cysteine--tRNA ligase [Pseudogemmobacter faecipullorum]|uniref:Cysteine--tRNA ligase n=1 Tax=Pseudogemmobacter faecipullorum TaxID=2755041 RepID=A0ABS8CK86_9RHOB|nr:cysteine--tRNA ligase [Pseudogemmobacter faecipullorum]MCB5409802.1 cysteine--tRNA ligase [Pseudogemmobacter faecipullorum]
MVTIRLTNSKTRRKEVFAPINPANVRMYVCGPTVYDRAHIGNARPVVVFDTLFRLLRHVYGAEAVTYARNFTDVDDKINARAAESGRPIREITDETIGWYHQDMDALGALRPTHEPRATEYIGAMIAMIEKLIADGHAYAVEGHALFRVRSYKDYGALSGRSVDDMIAGARVEVAPFKEDPMDFVLWKPSGAATPGWDSPWGYGRPGWHIECSAMAYELLGASFDIHGGGLDLQFPHHENEIAQSCCAHPGAGFAKIWMHNEMLQVEGRKMSKSLGNFFTVRDLLNQGYPGEVIRMVYLGTHYRKPMDWTAEKARQAEMTLRKAAEVLNSDPFSELSFSWAHAKAPTEVVEALANDLNTSLALTHVNRYIKENDIYSLVGSLSLLGLRPQVIRDEFASFSLTADDRGVSVSTRAAETNALADRLPALRERFEALRAEAMASKDFAPVDALKTALIAAGVEVRMSKAGVELVPGAGFDAAKLEALL